MEHPFEEFINKWKFHTHDDLGDLRILEFVPLMIRGVRHALLHRNSLELPTYGERLMLTLRVLLDPSNMLSITCMVHYEWDIGEQIQVTRF